MCFLVLEEVDALDGEDGALRVPGVQVVWQLLRAEFWAEAAHKQFCGFGMRSGSVLKMNMHGHIEKPFLRNRQTKTGNNVFCERANAQDVTLSLG